MILSNKTQWVTERKWVLNSPILQSSQMAEYMSVSHGHRGIREAQEEVHMCMDTCVCACMF